MKHLSVAAALIASIGVCAGTVRAQEEMLSGTISDSLCGLSHKEMAAKQDRRSPIVTASSHASTTRPRTARSSSSSRRAARPTRSRTRSFPA
jgi:hypothetical protein